MLKDAGDWGYTIVYWTLRDFVCVSWVLRWRGKWWLVHVQVRWETESRKVCVEVF